MGGWGSDRGQRTWPEGRRTLRLRLLTLNVYSIPHHLKSIELIMTFKEADSCNRQNQVKPLSP